MKTKEAIEFIKALFLGDVKNDKDEDGILYSDRANDIIELLQRGEKYEALYKEIKENVLNCEYCENIELKKLEQKHFPKPSDNFTEKVMEKINKEVDHETEIS